MKRIGALPQQDILQLIEAGCLIGAQPNNVQPASYDLTLSDEIWEVDGVLLPSSPTEKVRNLIPLANGRRTSMDNVIEIGKVYYVRLNERASLTSSVYGYANPKSSTGRIDLFVKLLADGYSLHDGCPWGYDGCLWVAIISNSFRIKLTPGLSLNQLRLFTENTRLDQYSIELENKRNPLLMDKDTGRPVPLELVTSPSRDGSIVLCIDLSADVVGWTPKKTESVLDLSRHDHDPDEFWNRLYTERGQLRLVDAQFAIASTAGGSVVYPHLAAEVAPVAVRLGEFRSHYAGFIDPGWGVDADGTPRGDTITLEIRAYGNLILRPGQAVGRLKYERMSSVPSELYCTTGTYTGQSGPRLSKHFASKVPVLA